MVTSGDRVKLVKTNDPYTSLQPGALGTVDSEDKVEHLMDKPFTQIWVKWDDGGLLALIPEAGDEFEIVTGETVMGIPDSPVENNMDFYEAGTSSGGIGPDGRTWVKDQSDVKATGHDKYLDMALSDYNDDSYELTNQPYQDFYNTSGLREARESVDDDWNNGSYQDREKLLEGVKLSMDEFADEITKDYNELDEGVRHFVDNSWQYTGVHTSEPLNAPFSSEAERFEGKCGKCGSLKRDYRYRCSNCGAMGTDASEGKEDEDYDIVTKDMSGMDDEAFEQFTVVLKMVYGYSDEDIEEVRRKRATEGAHGSGRKAHEPWMSPISNGIKKETDEELTTNNIMNRAQEILDEYQMETNEFYKSILNEVEFNDGQKEELEQVMQEDETYEDVYNRLSKEDKKYLDSVESYAKEDMWSTKGMGKYLWDGVDTSPDGKIADSYGPMGSSEKKEMLIEFGHDGALADTPWDNLPTNVREDLNAEFETF
jgi:hypothetical protein